MTKFNDIPVFDKIGNRIGTMVNIRREENGNYFGDMIAEVDTSDAMIDAVIHRPTAENDN